MPTQQGNKKQRKRQISLEEACAEAENKRRKKMARAKKRLNEGWVDVNPNSHKWVLKPINTVTAGARVAVLRRTSTISDIYLTLLPPAILVEIRKEVGKQEFFYGSTKVPLVDIYKMLAMTLFLRASRPNFSKGEHNNIFNAAYKIAKNYFDNKQCLGEKKYFF